MSLPPPRAWDCYLGVTPLVFVNGQWRPAPPVPEPYQRRVKVQVASHRVWPDWGSDGVRTWARWWCSCGAHGQGWPTSHPEES